MLVCTVGWLSLCCLRTALPGSPVQEVEQYLQETFLRSEGRTDSAMRLAVSLYTLCSLMRCFVRWAISSYWTLHILHWNFSLGPGSITNEEEEDLLGSLL